MCVCACVRACMRVCVCVCVCVCVPSVLLQIISICGSFHASKTFLTLQCQIHLTRQSPFSVSFPPFFLGEWEVGLEAHVHQWDGVRGGMCVHMCMHVSVCLHLMSVCLCVHARTHARVCVHACMCIHERDRAKESERECVRAHERACVRACKCVCLCVHTWKREGVSVCKCVCVAAFFSHKITKHWKDKNWLL